MLARLIRIRLDHPIILAATVAIQLGLIFTLVIAFAAINANTSVINQLRSEQRLQQQQSAQFVRDFLAEQNYVCEVVERFAQAQDIGLPPPNVTVCQVGVGTP